jgi:deoxyribonuclease V
MKLAVSHPWDLSVDEARTLQARLAEQVVAKTTFDPAAVRSVGGVDVSFRNGMAQAAAVVLGFPDLEPLDCSQVEMQATFPYVPGLLTFREGPSVLAALERLAIWPDLFLFDGHGVAHPNRIGLAAHMGVLLDHPTIGCAKSRLVGSHQEPGDGVGDWAPLYDREEIIGAVVRSRKGVKPLYVSIGHRVNLPTAIDFVLRCATRYRLPETTRIAHQVAGGSSLAIKPRQAAVL